MKSREPRREGLLVWFGKEIGDERGPTCLVRSTQAAAGFAAEVFVEEDVITPMGIAGVVGMVSETGAGAGLIRKEKEADSVG